MLTCFYGHPEVKKRIEGWNIMICLNNLLPQMSLVVDDFNEILYHKEKYGGARRPKKKMVSFHKTLTNYCLKDLGFWGRKFT